jgi:hypothetical protein
MAGYAAMSHLACPWTCGRPISTSGTSSHCPRRAVETGAVSVTTAHPWVSPLWFRGHIVSDGDWHVSRSRPRRRSASAKASASGSQRLKACEELRSQEVPGGWTDHDPRCHGGSLPSSQQLCCRTTLGARDRHRAIVIIRHAGADSTDSGVNLSIVCAVPFSKHHVPTVLLSAV